MKNIAYKEFDAWWYDSAQKELRQSCAVGWGFVVWQASREAIVVTLPEIDPFETEANMHIDDCADRIKAAGLTVAYDKENDNG